MQFYAGTQNSHESAIRRQNKSIHSTLNALARTRAEGCREYMQPVPFSIYSIRIEMCCQYNSTPVKWVVYRHRAHTPFIVNKSTGRLLPVRPLKQLPPSFMFLGIILVVCSSRTYNAIAMRLQSINIIHHFGRFSFPIVFGLPFEECMMRSSLADDDDVDFYLIVSGVNAIQKCQNSKRMKFIKWPICRVCVGVCVWVTFLSLATVNRFIFILELMGLLRNTVRHYRQ